VIVTLLSNGRMKVNQQEVPGGQMTEMEKMLRTAFSQTTTRLVILEGDRQAFLGSAIELMDYARKAGAERFAIATAPVPAGSKD
jgi:biopolymer transport protein ExbD